MSKRKMVVLGLVLLLTGAVCGYAASGGKTIKATKIELTTKTGVVKAVIQTRRDGKAGFEMRDSGGFIIATLP